MPDTQTDLCSHDSASDAEEAFITRLISLYAKKQGALIPVLQSVQQEFGYLSESAVRQISEKLGEPLANVFGVLTFYSFFSRLPRGKYVIRVCLGTACYVRGGQQVLNAFRKCLGIEVGQTTADRMFSLEVARCFGACGLAPVIMINDTVFQRVKPSKVKEILAKYTPAGKAQGKGDNA